MTLDKTDGEKVGITSFDDYSNWSHRYKFGPEAVIKASFGNKERKFSEPDHIETLQIMKKKLYVKR